MLGCFTNNVDSPGNDVRTFIGTPSAEECQQLCQKDSRCKYFMFKARFVWGFINACWLKSQKAETLRPKSGFVLGPKCCSKLLSDMEHLKSISYIYIMFYKI